MTSSPVLSPPSTCKRILWRKLFSTNAACVSAKPSSHGLPTFFTEVIGAAPVPPSYPEMVIKSAWALTTPQAITPIPGSETNLTEINAPGFTCFKSKINCAKSSIE